MNIVSHIHDKCVYILKDNNDDMLNLILDLDQTLIQAEFFELNTSFFTNFWNNQNIVQNNALDKYFNKKYHIYNKNRYEINFDSKMFEYESNSYKCIIHARKGMYSFLRDMKKHFNIYLYSNALLDHIQPFYDKLIDLDIDVFSGIICRENMNAKQDKYIEILTHLTPNNVIIIDDRTDIWNESVTQNIIHIRDYSYYPRVRHNTDYDLVYLNKLLLENKDKLSQNHIHDTIKSINVEYETYKKNNTFI